MSSSGPGDSSAPDAPRGAPAVSSVSAASGPLPRVRQHTLLRLRGGTTGVARLLHEALLAAGADAALSYEQDDAPGAASEVARNADPGAETPPPGREPGVEMRVSPLAAGAWALADGPALLHLHASADWQACLRGALYAGARTLLTLHDCRALTGGCPYPLRCREWRTGCMDPCPRGFEEARAACAGRRELLGRLRPVLAAPSRWLADMAREALPGLDVRVIPNGIPWPGRVPARGEARARLGLGAGPLLLFAAHGGTEAAYKRGWQWVESFARIRARVPGAQCFIVGGGRYERRDDGVTFWPYVDNATMLAFMRAADVLVYPSQADNHPLTVLEALSQGLAVAAFGAGGIPEQLADPEAGICVRSMQWAELEAAVVALLSTPGLARRMGERGFAYGRKRFTAERMAADYLKLYRRLGA